MVRFDRQWRYLVIWSCRFDLVFDLHGENAEPSPTLQDVSQPANSATNESGTNPGGVCIEALSISIHIDNEIVQRAV